MESSREELLKYLNLRPKPQAETTSRSITWICELNPVTTYQAWLLATTGKVKDWSQERSTDNDNSCSEKEKLEEIWCERKSENPGKTKTHRSSCAGFSEDGDKYRQAKGKVPSGYGDPKLSSKKEKPAQCSECSKAFRTHHQLVLHSKVHKRDRRAKVQSPTMSVDRRQPGTCFQELTTTVQESAVLEGEVSPDSLHLCKNAFGGKEMQPTCSREYRHCGKCFHSNSCLLIHLRTHTGEKPYICNFCDYVTAQKSSLMYQLKRHHKHKHPVDVSTEVNVKVKPGDERCSVHLQDADKKFKVFFTVP